MTRNAEFYIDHHVRIVDISPQIARYLPSDPTRRDVSGIDKIFVHHSGFNGARGVNGALNSTRYVMKFRDFEMPPYHYWLPQEPIDDGEVVIYQLAPHDWRCWHTGGEANERGVGVVCQGNRNLRYSRDHQLPPHQEIGLNALIPYLYGSALDNRVDLWHSDWLSWHSEGDRFGGRKKDACPGRFLQTWLAEYRETVNATRHEDVLFLGVNDLKEGDLRL